MLFDTSDEVGEYTYRHKVQWEGFIKHGIALGWAQVL
jgi:hypothetical protein